MDRALRPEFVAEALGEHAEGIVLPTVEQLIDLIAAVEVGAFAGADAVDEQLLETAWYLHGVASASLAADLYTAARQQRAFAVSAHIFDLALNTSNLSLMDRLNYAFAAQVGYRRADLDPNATAIWRRVDADLDDSPPHGPNAGEAQSVSTEEPPDDEADRSGEDTEPDTEAITSGIGLPRGSAFSLMALRAGIAFLGLDMGVYPNY